ncbi:MAG TPA: NADH-quinone oxidoreductase subunit D [Nitrososphaerales archaeon]|nr:NADH-quinone oxidoreductase subunit D [Nitrososphaerales archaeon]
MTATEAEFTPDSERIMAVSLGPQHPGAGHFRIRLWLDGDYLVRSEPDPGYVHRGEEKMGEYRNYIQNVPHLERPVILDSSNILLPYALAVDELMGNVVPPRAQYLRVIMSEINRIISHMYFLAIFGYFAGHTTMITWGMGDRDFWIDLAERIGGARVTFAYTIPGGVRNDMPAGLVEKGLNTCDWFDKRMDEYEKIFYRNPLVQQRTKGVGVLAKEDAIRLGATGTVLRASGVKHDLRRDEPYCCYDDLDFDVSSLGSGDCWDRAFVAHLEMRESVKIIRQALKQIPPGPVRLKLGPQPRVPPGEVYARTEAARGEMSYHIVSDGSPRPYRLKIGTPSFKNLAVLPHLLRNVHVADIPLIYWGLNYWPVESDR